MFQFVHDSSSSYNQYNHLRTQERFFPNLKKFQPLNYPQGFQKQCTLILEKKENGGWNLEIDLKKYVFMGEMDKIC